MGANTFFACLATQWRVIGALILRDLYTRFGRDNFGFMWFMLEPVIFCSAVTVLWRSTKGPYEYGIYPVVTVTFLGYMPMLLFRHCTARALNCGRNNWALLYHRQVTLLDLFLSRMVIEIAGNLLGCIIIFTVLYLLGLLDWPANISRIYLGYFYQIWLTIGTALIVGALSERSEVVEKVWQPISYINVPLSGAFMMAIWLPEPFRHWYLMIPSVSAFELIRSGYFGDGVESFWNQPYIATVSALTTLLGLYMLRQSRQYVVLE